MDVAKSWRLNVKMKKMSARINYNLYKARFKNEQVYNNSTNFEMTDYLNKINSQIPYIGNDLQNSVLRVSWFETKFGKFPISCPLACQCLLGYSYYPEVITGNLLSYS